MEFERRTSDARDVDLNPSTMQAPQIISQPLLTFYVLYQGTKILLRLTSFSIYFTPPSMFLLKY